MKAYIIINDREGKSSLLDNMKVYLDLDDAKTELKRISHEDVYIKTIDALEPAIVDRHFIVFFSVLWLDETIGLGHCSVDGNYPNASYIQSQMVKEDPRIKLVSITNILEVSDADQDEFSN